MTQHTPGPWYATTLTHDGETYSHVQSASINEDNYVARVDVMDEQGEANAALISAAPETAAERDRLRQINEVMVEALREAHSALRTFSPNVPEAEQCWTSFDSDTLEAIEAALAAAEARAEANQ